MYNLEKQEGGSGVDWGVAKLSSQIDVEATLVMFACLLSVAPSLVALCVSLSPSNCWSVGTNAKPKHVHPPSKSVSLRTTLSERCIFVIVLFLGVVMLHPFIPGNTRESVNDVSAACLGRRQHRAAAPSAGGAYD